MWRIHWSRKQLTQGDIKTIWNNNRNKNQTATAGLTMPQESNVLGRPTPQCTWVIPIKEQSQHNITGLRGLNWGPHLPKLTASKRTVRRVHLDCKLILCQVDDSESLGHRGGQCKKWTESSEQPNCGKTKRHSALKEGSEQKKNYCYYLILF